MAVVIMKPDLKEGEAIVNKLLTWLQLDTTHPDLQDTPKRIAKMYLELFEGLYNDEPKITVFDNTENYHDMIIVKDIDFSSVCAHHFLPFVGKAHIGYIPNGKYIGLSKLARVVDFYAKRPQVQERLTAQIANALFDMLNCQGLIIIMEAQHECMTVRGVKKANSITTTSAIRGRIDKNEFIQLISR
jgi:GTP cyclohydrolase I